MVKRTLATVAFVLAAGVSLLSFQPHAYAVSCDAIVGEWAWFTGGANMIEEHDEFGILTLKFKDLPGFASIRCKDRVVCDQMAADVTKLVEIARKYTHAGKKDDKKVQPSADPSQMHVGVRAYLDGKKQ
jgi:hypothetical protein